jgi:hypothetical protein
MRAFVRLQATGHVAPVTLGHGDWIGRLPQAALRFDDGRISEAHAMVSLRGADLWLLSLRGRLRAAGEVRRELRLAEDIRVELADGIEIGVMELTLPSRVMGFALVGQPLRVLSGTTSVVCRPDPMLVPGWDPEALAVVWPQGHDWRMVRPGAPPVAVEPGRTMLAPEVVLQAGLMDLITAGSLRTRQARRPPLRLEPAREGVRVVFGARDACWVGGVGGRLLGALAQAREPVGWRELSAMVWEGDRSSERSLRHRLDTTLSRVRRQLRLAGLEGELIRMDNAGAIALALEEDDVVAPGSEDEERA